MPWYGLAMERQWDGTKVDWLTGVINYALVLTAYVPDYDVHDFWNDVSANETTGTNYVTKGVILAGKTVTYDTATDEIRLDAGDAVYTTVTVVCRYGVCFENTAGADTTDPLLVLHDLGAQSVTAATLTVQFDATGVAKIDTT